MADGQAPTYKTFREAFLAAQRKFPALKRETQSQRGKYAPLDRVLEQIVPILNDHGIYVSQPTRVDGEMLVVETRLTHAPSGESEGSSYPVGPTAQQHQLLGAGLTYARRYALMAHCGIYPEGEDKDGDNAGRAGKKREKGPTDYAAAIAQMQVKLLNSSNIADLDRVWNANHKLRGALHREDEESLQSLEQKYRKRRTELMPKNGEAYDSDGVVQ